MIKTLPANELQELESRAKSLRRNIIKMITNAKSGHPGGNLSCVELMLTIYAKFLKHDPLWDKAPNFKNRDRFVLSKGHASATLYSVLAQEGYLQEEELMTFRALGSRLQGHPAFGKLPGVEVSTGSLGQGLSMACGMALGLKLDKIDSKVYSILGDGELQEGQIWEAALNAANKNLDNLIVCVDRNRLQIDGNTEDIKAIGDACAKFKAFGWNTKEIDGHNLEEVIEALSEAQTSDKPFVIVANTVKGKGVSFMENNAGWHGNPPSKEQCEQALEELKG